MFKKLSDYDFAASSWKRFWLTRLALAGVTILEFLCVSIVAFTLFAVYIAARGV